MQQLERFLEELDAHLEQVDTCQEAVRRTAKLLETYSNQDFPLPERLTRLDDNGYARHLVHHGQKCGCCVVAMVWGAGQGTPVHDHSGTWCVEACVKGKLRITNYELTEELPQDQVMMFKRECMQVGPGTVGSLIPPFEHHTIENPFQEKAITIHVYGKELDNCRRYIPVDENRYRVESVAMSYCSTPSSV